MGTTNRHHTTAGTDSAAHWWRHAGAAAGAGLCVAAALCALSQVAGPLYTMLGAGAYVTTTAYDRYSQRRGRISDEVADRLRHAERAPEHVTARARTIARHARVALLDVIVDDEIIGSSLAGWWRGGDRVGSIIVSHDALSHPQLDAIMAHEIGHSAAGHRRGWLIDPDICVAVVAVAMWAGAVSSVAAAAAVAAAVAVGIQTVQRLGSFRREHEADQIGARLVGVATMDALIATLTDTSGKTHPQPAARRRHIRNTAHTNAGEFPRERRHRRTSRNAAAQRSLGAARPRTAARAAA